MEKKNIPNISLKKIIVSQNVNSSGLGFPKTYFNHDWVALDTKQSMKTLTKPLISSWKKKILI